MSPTGRPVELTGGWRGLSGYWVVTQSGDCVVIEFLTAVGDEPLGYSGRAVFQGRMMSDFTIPGLLVWTWIRTLPGEVFAVGDAHFVTFAIAFDPAGDPELHFDRADLGFPDSAPITLARETTSTEWPAE